MIGQQVAVDVELIVGLHGETWSGRSVEALQRHESFVVQLHHFDDSEPLGRVLAALSLHATGDFVAKWDDDDIYGSHHLADLCMALAYSGAGIVGKAAEFVHLETSDRTVRRYGVGSESFSEELAGGTLMMPRQTLAAMGNWPDVASQVDRQLLEAARRCGVLPYRTHGFEYVLRRRGAVGSHTWLAEDSHFLNGAEEVWDGLNLVAAGFDSAEIQSLLNGGR